MVGKLRGLRVADAVLMLLIVAVTFENYAIHILTGDFFNLSFVNLQPNFKIPQKTLYAEARIPIDGGADFSSISKPFWS